MAGHLSRRLLIHISLIVPVAMAAAAQTTGGPVVQTEVWCVAKNNAEDSALQTAVDWACGPGGADCRPIQQGGPCYDPADIQQTASYAFNDYYLKHGLADDACSFANNAALTSLNPSHGSCRFPSSKTVSNGSIADATATPGMGQSFPDLSGCSRSRISSVRIWPFIIFSHMFTIARIIHRI